MKREILDVIELPLKHPEVFGKGVKRRAGILLYGPPGTGEVVALASRVFVLFRVLFASEFEKKNTQDTKGKQSNQRVCMYLSRRL